MIESQESITAKLCSFARAFHSNYARGKIFDDYLAYDMMGKQVYEEMGQLIEADFDTSVCDMQYSFCGNRISGIVNKYLLPIPLSRIAFAEGELKRFAKETGKCQYVICGAGMDTFAFRNENADIKIFELDHPDTQRYKLDRIRELEWNIPKNVNYVAIDFSKDDMIQVLERSGFDISVPTYFAILGVTYYLTLEVFEQTIDKISRISLQGNKVVFDFPDETTLTHEAAKRVKELSQITSKLGEPMMHGFSLQEIKMVLRRHGFAIDLYEDPETIQKKFFEGRAEGQKAFENIHFVLAVKEEESV